MVLTIRFWLTIAFLLCLGMVLCTIYYLNDG